MLSSLQLFNLLAGRLRLALGSGSPWVVLSCVHEPSDSQEFLVGFELVSEKEVVPGNYTMQLSCRLSAYAASGDVNHAASVRAAADQLARSLHAVLSLLPCGTVLSSDEAATAQAMVLESSMSTMQVGAWQSFSLFTIPFSLTLQQ